MMQKYYRAWLFCCRQLDFPRYYAAPGHCCCRTCPLDNRGAVRAMVPGDWYGRAHGAKKHG